MELLMIYSANPQLCGLQDGQALAGRGSLSSMSAALPAQFRHLAALWLFGAAALAATTWACSRLDVGFAAASFALLVVIVLLSLMDSLISSLVFSLIACVCLDYFFAPPLFTLFIYSTRDYWALATFVGASVIITTLVRRVRRLAETEHQQARLLDLTHDTIIVRDSNDVITYWNRGSEELYGWKKEEAVGRVTHDLLQTRFPAPLEDILSELSAVGRWEGELVHTKRDGSKVTVASRWSLQKDEGGRRVGIMATNDDITERKQAEEVLRRSQAAYLAEAQKLSATGSLGWNVASGDIFWSDESYRIFGYELTIRPTVELVVQRTHPDDAQAVRLAIDRAMNNHDELDMEHRLLMPDGEIRHVHVVAHPLAENPDQFVGALMDVTARVRAQETLQHVQADFAHAARVSVLGEMTASIAHEVSQPLMAISTDASASLLWLGRAEPDVGEAKAHIEHIVAAAARAAGIVTRVRAMASRRPPKSTVVAVNSVIGDTVAFLRDDLQANGVTLTLDLAQDRPAVVADATQLQQVVVNLAMNAIQAMSQTNPAGRQLIVRSSGELGAVKVTLDDTGPGIDADHQDRLFESFYTTKEGGMGMGLAICRSIVESYAGTISANNRAEGGARFAFTLPAAPVPEPDDDALAPAKTPS
jgi:PAS domain S-box-containing protein